MAEGNRIMCIGLISGRTIDHARYHEMKVIFSMTKKLLSLLTLVFSGLVLAAPNAWAQVDDHSDTLAIVGSSAITEQDLSRILSGRPNEFAGLPPSERRERMLELLVAEHLVDYFYGQNPDQLSEVVRQSISSARRQILLQLYTQWRFEAPEITDADVASYIEDNPAFFEDRTMYQFVWFRLAGGSAFDRQQAIDQIGGVLMDRPEALMPDLNRLVADLQQSGLNANLDTIWTTSESLEETVRLRLRQMVSENRSIDVQSQPDSANIILLTDATPIPISPDAVKPEQIRARLLQAAYTDHRERLVARMAASILEDGSGQTGSETLPPEIEVPEPGAVVWTSQPDTPNALRLAGFGASWVFALVGIYAVFSWLRLVKRQYPYLQSERNVVPALKRPRFSNVLGVLLLLVMIAILIGATWLGDLIFGMRTGAVFIFGAVIVALGVCWAWRDKARRALAENEKNLRDVYSDATMVRRQALMQQEPTKYLLAVLALLVAAGIGIVFMLSNPMSWFA